MGTSWWKLSFAIATFVAAAGAVPPAIQFAEAQSQRFSIKRFVLEGSTVLSEEEVDRALEPLTGPERSQRDVQSAIRLVESLYARKGYGTVVVVTPEQEISDGTIRFRALESKIGAVTVKYSGPAGAFSEENIRRSLPRLVENTVPNTLDIAGDVQVSNQNPAKNIVVTLKQAAQDNRIDATIAAEATDPARYFAVLENTGNSQTGTYRLGIGYQNANMFDRDQVLTAMAQTAPEHPDRTRIFTLSYRVPLYRYDSLLDVIVARSSVSSGTTQTAAGPLQVSGEGRVYAARYSHLLRRHGEYVHQIAYGWDVRAYNNACSLGSFGSAGCGPGGASVTVRPLTLSYAGQSTFAGGDWDFMTAAVRNLPGGPNGNDSAFNAARPDASGNGAVAQYMVWRYGASIRRSFAGQWRLAGSLSGQRTSDALVAAEQYGLSGAGTVRGYEEREVTRDVGYVLRIELRTPGFGSRLGLDSDLRAALFSDAGSGRNNPLTGELPQDTRIAGSGIGLYWTAQRTASLRIEYARAQLDGVATQAGSRRIHMLAQYSF